MDERILTICVPTYMREKKLNECLESIVNQIDDDIRQKVYLYIYDNNSSDGTFELCQKYIEKYDYIRYIRNEINIGPDRNFLKILSTSFHSQFCHLMSDDDLYCKNTLKKLINYLEQHTDLSFVYLNVMYFTEDKLDYLMKHKQLFYGNESGTYLSKVEFIKYVKNELSFLSGMIFNTKKINLNNSEKFINTNWLQSYMLFNSTIDSEKKLAFYSDVVVAKRDLLYEPDYDRFKVFGRNYYNLLKYGYEICGYQKKQLTKLLVSRYLKLIYWAKCNNIDRTKYKDIIDISKKEKYIKVLLFNCLPSFVCKLYYKLKHRRSN